MILIGGRDNAGSFNAVASIGLIMALLGGLFRHFGCPWNSIVSSAHDPIPCTAK
jgi:hypothetical protein